MTTYFVTPHDDHPWGGIRQIYAMVDALRRAGEDAYVVHGMRGFRCTWFANDTPVLEADGLVLHPDRDTLVIPEVYGPRLASMAPGIARIALIQNPYKFFSAFPLGSRHFAIGSGDESSRVLGAIVVSTDSEELLQPLFPDVVVKRVVPAINTRLFKPDGTKDRAIAYMSRKRRDIVATVLAMLSLRGALDGWELVKINAMTEPEVARELRRASVFLSFSELEGLGLPPLEAMASGCVVIGFDGLGGREYMDPHVTFRVDEGDLACFAATVEMVLQRLAQDGTAFADRTGAGVRLVRERYSPACFEESLAEAFTLPRPNIPACATTVRTTNAEMSFGPRKAPWWRLAITSAASQVRGRSIHHRASRRSRHRWRQS